MEINKIYNEDCFVTMGNMIKNHIKCDIILTSPPYNTGRQRKTKKCIDTYIDRYDIYIDTKTNDEYLKWICDLFNKFDECLSKNGCILWNMSYGSDISEGKNLGLMWLVIAEIINNTNFTIADRVIWKKNSALPNNTSSNKLTRIVEDVFVICRKNEYMTFNSNKQIKTISKSGQKYYENIFNYIEAKNNDEKCPYNKATFSSELCSNLLSIYAKNGNLVFDPFIGTGTTAISCIKNKLNYIGSELSKDQCTWSENRIRRYKDENS